MKTFDLTIHPAREPTTQSGWHIAWMGSSRPYVLWATPGQTEWRDGAMLRPIEFWAGPLPERSTR